MLKKLKRIENKYNLQSIYYKDEQVWAILRDTYNFNVLKDSKYSKKNITKKNQLIKLLKILKYIFYGFSNWFKKYDYIIFSDTQERIKINDKYYDKSFDKIVEIDKEHSYLLVELPNPTHYKINKIATKYIVSRRMLDIFLHLYIKFFIFFDKQKFELEQIDILNKKENYNINYQDIIKRFIASKKFYKIFLSLYNPKILYISCYYCNKPLVVAANELGIKTVEIQHGMIGASHYAYHHKLDIKKKYFSNVLLTYGEYDKELIEVNKYNPFQKIYPIGSFMLEEAAKKSIPIELQNIVNQYNYSFSISTQYTVEDELAKFIKDIAIKNKDMCFIFSLRHFSKEYYRKFNMPKNVYLFKGEYSCYDILKSCSIHITAYSTCSQEALFFEKRVVLVNINGLSIQVMGDIKSKSKNIDIVNSEDEFIKIIGKKFIYDKFNIYKKNYIKNIEQWLKEI